MTIEERIKEITIIARPDLHPYNQDGERHQEERRLARKALSIIHELQQERDKYKHLWETDSAQASEIIAELTAKTKLKNQLQLATALGKVQGLQFIEKLEDFNKEGLIKALKEIEVILTQFLAENDK